MWLAKTEEGVWGVCIHGCVQAMVLGHPYQCVCEQVDPVPRPQYIRGNNLDEKFLEPRGLVQKRGPKHRP